LINAFYGNVIKPLLNWGEFTYVDLVGNSEVQVIDCGGPTDAQSRGGEVTLRAAARLLGMGQPRTASAIQRMVISVN
jgi:hypothetical protein